MAENITTAEAVAHFFNSIEPEKARDERPEVERFVAAIGVWVLAMQTAVERATGERGSVVMMANAAGFALWALVLTLLSTGSHPLAPGPFVAESVWEAVVRLAPGAVR